MAEASEDTIAKSEVRAQSPDRTHAQLRDVVWDMFEVQDYRSDEAPTRPLDSLELRTKTHATHVPNLCRYDLVWVDFDKADPNDRGAGAPARAVAVSSRSYWTFLVPPTGYPDWDQDPVTVEACAALPQDHTSFEAPSELEAAEGYLAWTALRGVVATSDAPPIDCLLLPHETGSCAQVIAAASIDSLAGATRCTSDYGGKCYRLRFDDRDIEVTFDTPMSGSNPRIVGIEFRSLFVIRDRAVD